MLTALPSVPPLPPIVALLQPPVAARVPLGLPVLLTGLVPGNGTVTLPVKLQFKAPPRAVAFTLTPRTMTAWLVPVPVPAISHGRPLNVSVTGMPLLLVQLSGFGLTAVTVPTLRSPLASCTDVPSRFTLNEIGHASVVGTGLVMLNVIPFAGNETVLAPEGVIVYVVLAPAVVAMTAVAARTSATIMVSRLMYVPLSV
jgi:hypothetical protein